MSAPTPEHSTIVEFIADIFERRGAESYLGEAVTMAEHMLQGAVLAEQAGAPDELVAAALLHDIGHYTSEFGTMSLGDERDIFPPVITECVRLHVPAKRYLCATDAGYYDRLSDASKHTLTLQGGPMSAEEVKAFEANPYHREAVKVRIWDDEGKVPGVPTPGFRHYVPLLRRVVARHAGAAAA